MGIGEVKIRGVCASMGVARALVNTVLEPLVETPRQGKMEQCENDVCEVCKRGRRTEKRTGFMIWIVWQSDNRWFECSEH